MSSVPVSIALQGPEVVKEYLSLKEKSFELYKQKEAIEDEFKEQRKIVSNLVYYSLGCDGFNIQVLLDIITGHNAMRKVKLEHITINEKIKELQQKEEN